MSRSGQTVVSGTQRYKYFKRPIMPRVSAVPPQILLAPTTSENPLVPVDTFVEPTVKDAEVQTMYRESEAQTVPYTPNYLVQEGENPEVLLLKNLTYENGLPLGKKEIEMIEYSRMKREMEVNLPPFTDEASLILRKKLMEQQEMREFRLREAEIDIRRESRLAELEQALRDREESHEFMTSQRLEGVRQLRMEEKEKIMQKIRNKRIKALRRVAHHRNVSDPVLSDGTERDIINDYFDKGSHVYAPVQRDGKEETALQQPDRYDVASRTVPLDNIGNILSLEYTIPKRYLDHQGGGHEDNRQDNHHMAPTQLSKTAPVGSAVNIRAGGGGRAAEMRLTSAAARSIRNTKRDVEEMHHILTQRKHTSAILPPNSRPGTSSSADISGSPGRGSTPFHKQPKKPKGRPPTPDFTVDRSDIFAAETSDDLVDPTTGAMAITKDDNATRARRQRQLDAEFQSAVILLQRLIRGRAVQNIMFEGKYRRAELISELKAADDARALRLDSDDVKIDVELQIERETQLRDTTLDAVIGGASSHLLHTLAHEKARIDLLVAMQQGALKAVAERRALEGAEAGRRQTQTDIVK